MFNSEIRWAEKYLTPAFQLTEQHAEVLFLKKRTERDGWKEEVRTQL